MNDVVNILDDLEATGSTEQLVNLVEEHQRLQLELAEAEKKAKQLKERIHAIETQAVPDEMASLQIKEITLDVDAGEIAIDVRDIISGSIPSESAIQRQKDPNKKAELIQRRDECFGWLEENDAGSLIKVNVGIDLGRKESDKFDEIKEFVTTKFGLGVKKECNVHTQTLNAYLRDRAEQGKDVPFETFAVFAGKKATMKVKK